MFWVLRNAWASEQTLPQHVSAALPLPADLAKRILEKNRKEATTPTCGEGSGAGMAECQGGPYWRQREFRLHPSHRAVPSLRHSGIHTASKVGRSNPYEKWHLHYQIKKH